MRKGRGFAPYLSAYSLRIGEGTSTIVILLDLTNREVEVIRMALRLQEEQHKRNGFTAIMVEVQELRSKINDVILEVAHN